jgi:hypothetical protein
MSGGVIVDSKHPISFGDNVRVAITPDTERAGIAGLKGQIYGETTPSVTGVDVVGVVSSDFAFNVYFEDLGTDFWIAPELLELLDHAPGTEIHISGAPYKSIRQPDGTWRQVAVDDAKDEKLN